MNPMRKIVALTVLLLCAVSAFAQYVRIGDDLPFTSSTSGSAVLQYVPSVLVNIYNAPCTSLPCSTLATTYTDASSGIACSTSTQLVLQGTTACTNFSDPFGNWGAWVKPGQYCYVYTIGLNTYGPTCLTAPTSSAVGTFSAFTLATQPFSSVPNPPTGSFTIFSDSGSGNLNCKTSTGGSCIPAGLSLLGSNNTWTGTQAFNAGITTTTLAASSNGTVGGTLGVTGNITGSASAIINGPSPWFDVSANASVDCTGTNDSTTALQAIVNSACALQGATIYFPDPLGCHPKVSSLNFSSCSNITVRGANGGGFGIHGNYNLTFTCTTGPCLNLNSATSIHTYDLAFNFPNVTAGPIVDQSLGGSSGFHHTIFHGPGTTIGPMFLDAASNFNTWDNWTSIQNTSVAVQGASIAHPCCSDLSIFDHVTFSSIGTSVMQDASINWTVSNSNWLNGIANCQPFLQYTGISGAFEGNFNWINSSITGEPNCSNNFTLFTFPAVGTTNAPGVVNFQGGLLLGNSGTGVMTLFNLGNGQTLNMNGTNICGDTLTWNVFNLGSNVTLNVSGNSWNPSSSSCTAPSTFYVGGVTPVAGSVTDNTGKTFTYGQTLAPDGTLSAPSYSFGSNGNQGWLARNGLPVLAVGGFGMFAEDTTGQRNRQNAVVGWSSSGVSPDAGANDTGISRPNADEVACGNGSPNDTSCQFDATILKITATAFASLGTPANGTLKYCNDCTVANPCAGSGTGALAKRLNGVWVCN
jgi:hypothetical protein